MAEEKKSRARFLLSRKSHKSCHSNWGESPRRNVQPIDYLSVCLAASDSAAKPKAPTCETGFIVSRPVVGTSALPRPSPISVVGNLLGKHVIDGHQDLMGRVLFSWAQLQFGIFQEAREFVRVLARGFTFFRGRGRSRPETITRRQWVGIAWESNS
jgi:hypothetical protein